MRDPKILQIYVDTITKNEGQICDLQILAEKINSFFNTNVVKEELNAYLCIDQDVQLIVDNSKIQY